VKGQVVGVDETVGYSSKKVLIAMGMLQIYLQGTPNLVTTQRRMETI